MNRRVTEIFTHKHEQFSENEIHDEPADCIWEHKRIIQKRSLVTADAEQNGGFC
jgi:hypothetical protein